MPAIQEHILVVDDDDLTLQALRRSLDIDATIETVMSASEAAELVKRKKYAVVLTDLIMPGMNGLELIETIRIISPDTLCVILSGRVDQPYPHGLPSNVISYLHKPCSRDEMKLTLDAALMEYRSRAERLHSLPSV